MDNTDFTAVTNNSLHSLFSQCDIAQTGLTLNSRSLYLSILFETVLTYGSAAAASHLTDAFRYLDNGHLLPCDPTAADARNKVFITLATELNIAMRSTSMAQSIVISVIYREMYPRRSTVD